YYELHRADRDGMAGFLLAFHSAFYRFESRAKLWDLRRQRGQLNPHPSGLGEGPGVGAGEVPRDFDEVLAFLSAAARDHRLRWLAPLAQSAKREAQSDPNAPSSPLSPSPAQRSTLNALR